MTDVAAEPAQYTAPAGVPQSVEALWRTRISGAQYHRRPFEIMWLLNLAFASGQQWTVVDRHTRTLRDISEVDVRYEGADLYVADFIKEQRGAALGELTSDSERPELLVPDDSDNPVSDSIQEQLNQAVDYGWDFEWDGDVQLMDVRRKCVDLGVAAMRCRFDKNAGKQVKSSTGEPVSAPLDDDGHPITDGSKAHDYVAGKLQAGAQAKFSPVNEGKIRWETGSAFNLLVPPGVPNERDFPWEIWVRPVPLADVQALYPAAAGMRPDEDIGSVIGITVAQGGFNVQQGGYLPSRLADHVWLYTGYERATPSFPKGRVAVLAGAQKRLLEVTPKLPYEMMDGTWSSGIVYFHWWRMTDRFWSIGLVETLKDSQRMTNRTATQVQEIIDRSMPFVIVEEDSIPQKPGGKPMEWVEVKKGTQVAPQAQAGVGPGQWMAAHRAQLMEDAQHASTLSSLKLGENPTNVDTYSQLALLQDQEASKRSTIRNDHQNQVGKLVELSVQDISRYWPESKQILIGGGKENELRAIDFKKSSIPALFIVKPAKGSAKPRSQAAQLQLIQDIWNAAIAAVTVQQDPLAWVQWLKESYQAGEPLALPSPPADNQLLLARRENYELLNGEQPAVAYWDQIETHLPIHRDAEDHARMAGDVDAINRIEQHIKEHQDVQRANAAQLAQVRPTQPGLPLAPGAAAPPVIPGAPVPALPPPAAGPAPA